MLIALTISDHEHHARASAWASGIRRFAVCPVVEGALVRFLVRVGEAAGVAKDLVRAVQAHPSGEFWPDSLSYAAADLGHVRGHRQVTDAYLVSLAAARGAVLASLDEGLAEAWPERVVLVPDRRPAAGAPGGMRDGGQLTPTNSTDR